MNGPPKRRRKHQNQDQELLDGYNMMIDKAMEYEYHRERWDGLPKPANREELATAFNTMNDIIKGHVARMNEHMDAVHITGEHSLATHGRLTVEELGKVDETASDLALRTLVFQGLSMDRTFADIDLDRPDIMDVLKRMHTVMMVTGTMSAGIRESIDAYWENHG